MDNPHEQQPGQPGDRTGNEPAPIIMLALAAIPVVAVLGWLAFS